MNVAFWPRGLLVAGILSMSVTMRDPAYADTVEYSFSGTYATVFAGAFVSLDYSGTFSVVDPTMTAVRPPYAADVSSPALAEIWEGVSTYYTGAGNLNITFANGATVTSDVLALVVNNTTVSNAGSPYPLGQSVQLYSRGAAAFGMTATKVCADGSIDDICDASGDDPVYERGDASEATVLHMTGIYFAFYGAPLREVNDGVPELAGTFGATGGGLGIFSVNELGQNVTTLTQFREMSSVTSVTTVPEPRTWLLCVSGLGLTLLRRRTGRASR